MAAEKESLFGNLVVRNGFASESEVELALDAQKQADPSGNPKIGEILVEMGTLDRQKVDALLVEQAVLRKEEPARSSPSLPVVQDAPPGAFKLLLRRAGEKLRRLFRDVTGKRAREKAAASERRDQLLAEIARAAVAAGATGSEADSVRKTGQALEAAKKQTGVAAKSAVKAAEGKHQRALLKLGRTLADKGGSAQADEVKTLDATIKDLS